MNRSLTATLRAILSAAVLMTGTPAQSQQTFDLTSIGQDARWKISNRTATTVDVKGKRAVRLSEGLGMGVVWLDGYDFKNGVIELDILGRSQPVQGSFVGVVFHAADAVTYEAVYFRPFNFQAADPERRAHAVQYVSHPKWTWQTLRADHLGVYESAVAPAINGDEWFHARIVVERPKISVFVNGSAQPCLVVTELGDRSGGSLGLWVGEGSGGTFANLRVHAQ